MFSKQDFNFFPGSLGLFAFPQPCSLSGLGPREAHPLLGVAWILALTVVPMTLGAGRAFLENSPCPSLPATSGMLLVVLTFVRLLAQAACSLKARSVMEESLPPKGPISPVSPQASCLHLAGGLRGKILWLR